MQGALILLATATALLAVQQIISDIRINKLMTRAEPLENYTVARILMEKKEEEQKNGNEE